MSGFGVVKRPINDEHNNTSEYLVSNWEVLKKTMDVKLYSMPNGNALLEESTSASYSSK